MRPSLFASACAPVAVVALVGVLAAGLAGGASCSSSASQQQSSSTGGTGGSPADSNFIDPDASTGPPSADAGGYCGNRIHQLHFDAANIYFVLDRSGSMDTVVGTQTRYEHVHDAAVAVVQRLGPRINVGAAVFPLHVTNGCDVGGQVFKTTPGDPIGAPGSPTANAFASATNVLPTGGTPTAGTLVALLPTIAAIPGRTIVVLATDGAPNCHPNLQCDQSACTWNIEGDCPGSMNCCAPTGSPGPAGCVDRDAVIAAIAAYKAKGILVAVVGIPGSEYYDDLLASMAIAGGAPQIAPPFYYKVTDLGNLTAVIGGIVGIVVSCDFELADPPPVPDFTNVYFDDVTVPENDANGWVWKTKTVIELHGDACNQLKSGSVGQVQIVSGCPTKVSK